MSGSRKVRERHCPAALVAIGIAVALAGACSAAGNSPPAWAVRHVAVFDSEAKRLVSDQTIVVRSERIERAGNSAEVVPPKGAPVVDGRGKYVIPGLIDAHTHVSTVLYSAFMTGDEILPFFLANGVTAIRVAGDGVVAQKLVWRYAEIHPALSPRIFLASPLIGSHPPIHPDAGWTVTRPDDVPAFVSAMAGWGVTSLKIYANCLPAVARRVIEEGHRQGLMVIGHLSSYPVDDAIDDGIDSIEHIESVSDFLRTDPKDRHSLEISTARTSALVSKIAKRGTFVDPTLSVYWGTLFFADVPEVIEHPDNLGMPERLRKFWAEDREKRLKNYSAGPLERRQRTFEQYKSLAGILYRAGAKLLVGTDAPEPQVPPGYSLHHEMQLLVESGVPPAEVLRAATWNNAAVVRRQHEIGSVRAGMLADFVILDADPLADIRNTRKIFRVVKGGQMLEPSVVLRSVPRE